MGRITSQGSCLAFGGLPPRQSRLFVRGSVRWCSAKAGNHKADLVLDAHFEPTTCPAGCDKDAYRRYYKRSMVYVLGRPLKDRVEDIKETIRGLRPDAVVLMPLPPHAIEMMKRAPEKAEQVFTKEVIVAYKEAKALPDCTVVCDALPLRPSFLQLTRVWLKRSNAYKDLEKRMNELREKYAAGMSAVEKKGNRSELRKLTFETYPDMRVIFTKPELHMAYLLQRTLNKRASEKYKRLKASKKDQLGPVRIVSL
ncbi:hypothetical protein AAVH_37225, partial [Aphelenchoides avenae]